ncbi:MAG: glycosyltransferase, partial [Clostridiales bacterium]|nr:glycosyltransferase [Clostridiales bacterium]
VYNVEKFLSRCIESILAQSYNNYELILVDDGSSDNSGKICDEYEKQDNRIKVIHKQNGGLADARNAGLKISRGKFVLFCDSDDYVSNTWCEHFMEYSDTDENSYIVSGYNYVTSNSKKCIPADLLCKTCPIEECFSLQNKGIFGYAWNALFRASILKQFNIHFSTDVIVEDLPFTLNYLSHMKSIVYTGYCDYNYYHDDRETLSNKYYKYGFTRWQEKYRISQQFISENVSEGKQLMIKKQVADMYLYYFLNSLANTFDNRNTDNHIKKLQYNSHIVSTDEFQECLHFADCSHENPNYIHLLKEKNYPAAYLLWKSADIKNTIKRRIK